VPIYKCTNMILKWFLIFLFSLITTEIFAQEISYPNIVTESNSINGFIPKGWRILNIQKGNLDKDGIEDCAFIIETVKSYKAFLYEDKNIEYRPRILAIIFGVKNSNSFQLKEQSNSFIITRAENTSMDEPFQGMTIESNGTIRFNFYYWFSSGSWYITNQTFIFRYQNNKFELIGYDSNSLHRSSHGENSVSINYSTKKFESFTSKNEEDKGKKRKGNIKINKLVTINEINPYDFSPSY